MANNIELVERFLRVLDEKYTSESKTSRFDASNSDITFIDNNVAKIYTLSLAGFGDYSNFYKAFVSIPKFLFGAFNKDNG